MRSMYLQLGILGTISAFAYRHRETEKNLCRGGQSQDLRWPVAGPSEYRYYVRSAFCGQQRIFCLVFRIFFLQAFILRVQYYDGFVCVHTADA